MRDFWVVMMFELKNRLKQKATIISTTIIIVLLLGLTFVPRFLQDTPSTPTETVVIDQEFPQFGVVTHETVTLESIKEIPYFQNLTSYQNREDLVKALEAGTVEYGLIVDSFQKALLMANDIGMFDSTSMTISSIFSQLQRDQLLRQQNIDPAVVDQATLQSQVDMKVESLGKSQANSFWFVYIGVFIIYFLIILYGTSVSTAVAREKNDRTMELLITNTSSTNLIWGKVVASTIVSGSQMILTLLAGVIGYTINKAYYPDMLVEMIRQGIGLDLLVLFVVFAILGMFLYYFLYAAVGALVSKVEEVNSAMTPIQILFIAGYAIVMFGLYMPESFMMKFASIFPFTSSITMFARYALITVPMFEIVLSLALLILTALLMAYISVRIYRMGTLNYGNRIGFIKALRMIFTKEGQV